MGGTVAQLDRLGTALDAAQRESAEAARAVDQVERTISQVAGYRTLGREVLAAGRAHREAEARVRALARELAQSERPTRAQEQALAQARREVERTAAAAEAKQVRFRALGNQLREAGVDTRNLAAAERRLAGDLASARARADETAGAVGRLEERMERAERRSKAWSEMRNAGLAIGALAGAVSPMVRAAGNLEEQLSAFGLVAGVSDEQLTALRATLRGLSREVNQSTDALLAGVGILVGRGMDYDAAVAAIGAIGKTATATGSSIEDMSGLAFSVMENLKVPAAELQQVLDIMAKAGDLGGFELKDMASYFPQLTASAAALGLEGANGVATLAAALQVAMKGASDAGTAANNFANFLQKATAPETVRNFEKFGIDIKQAMQDALLAGENPMEAMVDQIGQAIGADLEGAVAAALADGQSFEQAAAALEERFNLGQLFGDAQVLNFLAPMIANIRDYQRIRDEAFSADGVVDEKFARMTENFNAATKGFGVAWANLSEAFGRSLLPVLTPALNVLSWLVNGLGDLIDQFPLVTSGITGLVTGFMLFRAASAGVSLALTFLNGGIPALVARLIGLQGASAAAAAAQGGLGLSAMATSARMGAAGLLGSVGALGRGLLGFARTAIPAVIGGLRMLTVAMMTNPIGLIVGGIALAAGLIISNWEAIGPFFSRLWQGVQQAIASPWEAIKTALSWSPLGLVVSNWQPISQYMSDLWGGIVNMISGILDWITSKLEWVGSAVSSLTSWLGDDDETPATAQATSPSTPPPALAPMPAGPTPSVAPAGMAAAGGPITINAPITIHAAPGMDENQIAALVRRELETAGRRAEAARRGALHDG